ncbi:molybdopterin-dependent oxidoreductase [Streptomyces cinereospinus]|uniref:Molybdopterin-dependent oxidoreductase n=1 Tax=Streptomyces cinereospinus TaxID=285561 RepID=A0ABV5N365_9ACTN
MACAEYGCTANLRLTGFATSETSPATHHNGASLTAERGFPPRPVVPHRHGCKSPEWLRALAYPTEDRRGCRAERGCRSIGDPGNEQCSAHREQEGDGPTPPAS